MEKFLLSLALFGLVAMTTADQHHYHCTPLDIIKVQHDWAHAYGEGHHRLELGTALFKGLFAHDPEARELFKHVHSDDVHHPAFQALVARVLGGLDLAISVLDDEPVLHALLNYVHEQYKARNIPLHHFDDLGHVLWEVLPAELERCFDREAWEGCYHVITEGITKGFHVEEEHHDEEHHDEEHTEEAH